MDTYEPDDQPQENTNMQRPPLIPEHIDPQPIHHEDLNPWISIVYRPRDTIHYLLNTGAWNNVWLVYAIVFVGTIPQIIVSIIAQPPNQNMPDLPEGLSLNIIYAIIIGLILIFGYPLGMLMLYIKAWLYKVVGSWLDGQGTNQEVRITEAWVAVLSMYMNLLMFPPYLMLAVYYQTAEVVPPAAQLGIGLAQVAVGLPLFIVYMIIGCKALGEAHRFSAWRAFGTVIISFFIMMAVMMFLGFLLVAFFFMLGMAMSS